MPPVARDQPNGFRLTPHTPRSETSPPLLSSPLPSRRAMPVQNTPDETLLFYWLWYLSPYGVLPFDTLPRHLHSRRDNYRDFRQHPDNTYATHSFPLGIPADPYMIFTHEIWSEKIFRGQYTA